MNVCRKRLIVSVNFNTQFISHIYVTPFAYIIKIIVSVKCKCLLFCALTGFLIDLINYVMLCYVMLCYVIHEHAKIYVYT